MRMHLFRAQNGPFVLNKVFLVQPIIITSIYLLALFTMQNFKKFLQRIQRYFGPKIVHLPQPFFGGKLLISFSSTYQPLSLCKLLEKFFQRIQSYNNAQFLDPKWSIPPNENFFRKPVNEHFFLSFLPIYMLKSKVRY